MRRFYCRICESSRLVPVLDLGATPLANRLLRPDETADGEPLFPLRMVLCLDCGLVQLDEDVPPDLLVADYLTAPGGSDWMAWHSERLARALCGRHRVRIGDLVLEAGSGDGATLLAFQWQGARVLGVEPVERLAQRARAQHVESLAAFFNEPVARAIREQYGPAKLFVARHVLARAEDLQGFVQGIKHVLAPEGVGVIEVPHVAALYERLEFDTIYHEHRCYFSLTVLMHLLARFRLTVIDVDRLPMQGGSLLVQAVHEEAPHPISPRVETLLRKEEEHLLASPGTWRRFAKRVAEVRDEIHAFLELQGRRGLRLAGYGAAERANTLLAYCDIGPDQLPYIADKNPNRQGRLTPGRHIPVVPLARLLEDRPDLTLILAWNFADEIAWQQAAYRRLGSRFALPLPTPHFVGTQEVAA